MDLFESRQLWIWATVSIFLQISNASPSDSYDVKISMPAVHSSKVRVCYSVPAVFTLQLDERSRTGKRIDREEGCIFQPVSMLVDAHISNCSLMI